MITNDRKIICTFDLFDSHFKLKTFLRAWVEFKSIDTMNVTRFGAYVVPSSRIRVFDVAVLVPFFVPGPKLSSRCTCSESCASLPATYFNTVADVVAIQVGVEFKLATICC